MELTPRIDDNTLALVDWTSGKFVDYVGKKNWWKVGTAKISYDETYNYVYEGNADGAYNVEVDELRNHEYTIDAIIRLDKNHSNEHAVQGHYYMLGSTNTKNGFDAVIETLNNIMWQCWGESQVEMTQIEMDKWYHVASVYKDGIRYFFINGQLFDKREWVPDFYDVHGTKEHLNFKIGQAWDETSKFNLIDTGMKIARARISSIARWTSNFDSDKAFICDNSGLIIAKSPVNLASATKVYGINITGQEPENTKRRLIWNVDGVWNKLTVTNGTAALTKVATQSPTVASVLSEGNTVQEVATANSIPPFVGKLVYPAVAMCAGQDAIPPTLHLYASANTYTALYSYTEYSQEYNLIADTLEGDAKNVTIADIVADVTTEGQGNVDITVSLKQGDVWTDYMPPINAHMKKASAIKLKAVYTVKEVGGKDAGHINSVKVTYTDGGSIVNGTSTDIVTKTQEFENKLSYVHAHVKHNKLIDSKIKAYISLRETPKKREMVQVGNGTGAKQTIKLSDIGINQDTIIVYIDGKQFFNFDYNVETSEITLITEKDSAISASYQYGWNKTEWKLMNETDTQETDRGYYTTTYEYVIPTDSSYTVSAIKYQLERPTGKVSNEVLGTATGKRQIFRLNHMAKKETISCNFPASYDYKNQTLKVIGDKGKDIVVSYDWIAESPHVYGVMAGWAD